MVAVTKTMGAHRALIAAEVQNVAVSRIVMR